MAVVIRDICLFEKKLETMFCVIIGSVHFLNKASPSIRLKNWLKHQKPWKTP